jgi:hypothetical protein
MSVIYIYPLATKQVEIDLDDGVKVNYAKVRQCFKKDSRNKQRLEAFRSRKTRNYYRRFICQKEKKRKENYPEAGMVFTRKFKDTEYSLNNNRD